MTVIQRHIPHYRVDFFAALEREARRLGYRQLVISGQADRQQNLPFRHRQLRMRSLTGQGDSLGWMAGLEEAVAGSDVVVAPHELQCLTIPYLWVRRRRLCSSWIWWGHGYNFQAVAKQPLYHRTTDIVKDFLIPRADGMITYTLRGAQYWYERGMTAHQVLPFFNTLDVDGLRQTGDQITEADLARARERLNLKHKHVLLFSGRLYAEKAVDFLLDAFAHIQTVVPDTALLIVGDGEDRPRLEMLCRNLRLHDVHFLGEVTERLESSLYFRLAQLLVIPGLVGLAIVHGFAFNLPLITTEQDSHGPEIEYMSEDNGCITEADPQTYACTIIRLLSSPARMQIMREHAGETARRLTLSASAGRFMQAVDRLTNTSTQVPTDRRRFNRTVLNRRTNAA